MILELQHCTFLVRDVSVKKQYRTGAGGRCPTVGHRAPPPCCYRYRACLKQGTQQERYRTSTLEHHGGVALQTNAPLLHQGTRVRYHTVPEQGGGTPQSTAPLLLQVPYMPESGHPARTVPYFHTRASGGRCSTDHRPPTTSGNPSTVPYRTVAAAQSTEHRPPCCYRYRTCLKLTLFGTLLSRP